MAAATSRSGLTTDLALGPPPTEGDTFAGIVLNEISAAGGVAPLRVELYNTGSSPALLGGAVISVSGDPEREWVLADDTTLEAGQFLVVDDSTFDSAIPILDQDRVFLLSPDRRRVIDARQASSSLRGRVATGEFEGRWLRPDTSTFGEQNSFTLQDGVVINEIFYHAYPERGFPDVPPELGNTVLLPMAASWRYQENVSGEGLAAGWADSAHSGVAVGFSSARTGTDRAGGTDPHAAVVLSAAGHLLF